MHIESSKSQLIVIIEVIKLVLWEKNWTKHWPNYRNAVNIMFQFFDGQQLQVKERIVSCLNDAIKWQWEIDFLQVLDEYERVFGNSWQSKQSDNTDVWPYLDEALAKFQVWPLWLPCKLVKFLWNPLISKYLGSCRTLVKLTNCLRYRRNWMKQSISW